MPPVVSYILWQSESGRVRELLAKTNPTRREVPMQNTGRHMAVALAALLAAQPGSVFGASHREAPITALDRAADIADFYAFVSYDDPTKVTSGFATPSTSITTTTRWRTFPSSSGSHHPKRASRTISPGFWEPSTESRLRRIPRRRFLPAHR
jgi:hypothetical protein